jgi:hypothetical protein
MESLLRLSGLLSEEDGGATDLGTLEKKLADRSSRMSQDNGTSSKRNSTPGLAMEESSAASEGEGSEPKSPAGQGSPKPRQRNGGKSDEEVEALSDMMCSLVTNNCGETRYIGMSY